MGILARRRSPEVRGAVRDGARVVRASATELLELAAVWQDADEDRGVPRRRVCHRRRRRRHRIVVGIIVAVFVVTVAVMIVVVNVIVAKVFVVLACA